MNLYYSKLPSFFTGVKGDCVSLPSTTHVNKVYHVPPETPCTIDGSVKTLLVPAVSAQDVSSTDLASHEWDNKPIPGLLASPLLKHPTESIKIEGYHSGRRSALVLIEGVWYRLKGCGDLLNGIANRKPEYCDDSFVELRGVQYENTTIRELYITQLVNNALIQNGLIPANEPLAYWKYATEWPVPCTCAIFTTRGDKRLNDHVLFGLESLLPLLINENDVSSLIQTFSPDRICDNEVLPTWCVALDENSTTLIDLRGSPLHERPPADINELVQKYGHKDILDLNLEILRKGLQGSTSFLASLYWRLGWETGRILKVIHTTRISWGTYPDKLGIHCNSHPNNLVLLSEGKNLLAPLDFDMAFTEKSVTNLTYVDSFSDLLAMEVRSMRLALAGDSELNSGTTGVATLPDKYMPLKWGLRDTLVQAFDSGYKDSTETPVINENISRALLELSLVISSDIVA